VRLRAEQASRWEADAKLEALWTSATRVWDLVLSNANGLSSLAASMSIATELLEGQIDGATTNKVRWGSRSVLVATVSHLPELETELEELWSGRSEDLTEEEVDAFWTRVCLASDLLGSHVPSLVTLNLPDGVGE
jgi:hypothetical protein